jgi:hypothetical protein
MGPRFDLSKAYWIIAAIAGVSYLIADGYKEVTASNGEALSKNELTEAKEKRQEALRAPVP